jgi:serine/threonine protein phosphatase 1
MFFEHRILGIGDIHGGSRAFDALLCAVAPMENDVIITLGDYIDRGGDSSGVIDRLIRLSTSHHLIPLRGNHEEMMMDARRGPELLQIWQRCGGNDALRSYGIAEPSPDLTQVPSAHWEFLDHTCRDMYQTADHFFVHGGVDAELPLDRQSPGVLHWTTFPPRRPHVSKKTMVCGHTPQPSGFPKSIPHAICLDTGAGHGGWLTCLDVDSGQLWQANERGEVRESVLMAPRRRW